MKEKMDCPGCGDEYERLGMHWAFNENCRPELTERQKDISTGLIMGDGWIEKTEKNARLSTFMINQKYLEYIDNIFGCLSTGVQMKYTAEESAKHSEDVGALGSSGEASNFSNLYRWQTRIHPYYNKYRSWYSSGEKQFPDNIELSPTIMKHWFVSDGCFQMNKNTPYATLGVSNEIGNEEKLEMYFEEVDLEISFFNNTVREDGSKNMTAIFNKEETLDLFEYMGDAIPGFEYKFPKSNGGEVEVKA